MTSQESRPKPAAEAGRVAGTQAARGLSSPPDPPSLTWSVRQEVEELLSAQAAKEKNEQVRLGAVCKLQQCVVTERQWALCPAGCAWIQSFSSLYAPNAESRCPRERQQAAGENSRDLQVLRAGWSCCVSQNSAFCLPSSATPTRKSQIHKEPRKRAPHRLSMALTH